MSYNIKFNDPETIKIYRDMLDKPENKEAIEKIFNIKGAGHKRISEYVFGLGLNVFARQLSDIKLHMRNDKYKELADKQVTDIGKKAIGDSLAKDGYNLAAADVRMQLEDSEVDDTGDYLDKLN